MIIKNNFILFINVIEQFNVFKLPQFEVVVIKGL